VTDLLSKLLALFLEQDTANLIAPILLAIIQGSVLVGFVALSAVFFIWLERKVAGRIQDRLGPTRVGGKFGWLQTLADGMKLLVKEDPDNASYNNDLGYVWADNDMNLDEAEKLIRKAIVDDKKKQAEKKPGAKPEEIKANAAYLDSLGWVLYKQKKYKDALQPLQEAVQAKEGQSIEIYDHLAEVHMALGEMGAALGAWKKGVEKAGPSKREQERKVEVEKKIKTNQEKK